MKKPTKKTTSLSHTLDDVTKKAAELAKDKTPLEVGDIISEYQKKWAEQMQSIIKEHANYAPKYFILQWIHKEHGHINILRNKCYIRKTRPDPDWNTDCYSYNNETGDFVIEWTLPPKEAAVTILRNPTQYDPRLIQSIQRFLSGELQRCSSPELQQA